MFCHKCGSEIEPGSKFCPICGTPVLEEDQLDDYNKNILQQDFPPIYGNNDVQQDWPPMDYEDYTVPKNKRNGNAYGKEQEEPKDKVVLGVLVAIITILGVAVVVGGIMLVFFGKKHETVEKPQVQDVVEQPSIPDDTDDEDVDSQDAENQTSKDQTSEDQTVKEQTEDSQVSEKQTADKTTQEEKKNTGGVLKNDSFPAGESNVQVNPNQNIQTTGGVQTPSYNYSSVGAEFIIPDSSIRYLTTTDLNMLSEWEIRIARNEIYARRGRIFKSEDLQDYFGSKSWYHPTVPAEAFDNSYLNKIEIENLKTITNYEKAHNLNQ